jgi:hypothetical protein
LNESPQATESTEPLEFDPPVPVADVESLLSTMAKALRAFNMYQENNPIFQRFQQALHEGFAGMWEQTDALELTVTEEGFKYYGHLFNMGQGRDSFSFAFYKDGVRNLTFLQGFEDEVSDFLDAVNRAMKREADADDLITVLWERDFASLQYGYVDLLMEGLSLPDQPMKEPQALDGGEWTLELTDEEPGTERAVDTSGATGLLTTLSRDSFDETLYFLDQAEMAALQTEVEIEMERDLRSQVLNALFDRFEEGGREGMRREILDILDQLLPLFLSRGDMQHAATILEELDEIGDADEVPEGLRERIERVFGRLSDPEVLEQFVQALEDGAVAPQAEEVNLFFSRLHPQAMPVLIRFSEMSETPGVRGRLASAIDGLAARYPAEVDRLLDSDEPAIVTGAARVAGRVGLASAVAALHRTLSHPDKSVRMAVVEALVSIRLTPALQALITALDDEDRDVRIAAATALGTVRFASARDALAAAVEAKRMKDADLTEKMAFFEAYGAVGGSKAVVRLSEILNEKGFLGRRNPTELRACAALGLGQAGTPEAQAALEKARADDDPIVRNAVVRALNQDLVTR